MSDKENLRLSATDPHSFSNPEDAVIQGVHIKLEVNFTEKVLSGSAYYIINVNSEDCDTLILDTNKLKIKKVAIKDDVKLDFTLYDPVPIFGSKLEISLPSKGIKQHDIRIDYETSPDAGALQWLEPSQTAGKKHPYLFSQCQAIHARSLLPCQDTPAVKMTYGAEILVERPFVAVMSATALGVQITASHEHLQNFKFMQTVPMPSYLVAIAVGQIESRPLGLLSKVWSEKAIVEAAAKEFSEIETVMTVAESLIGKYIWGDYDILVLPPSFPYGGMENPCLIFATPTIIAGDRSLVDVIGHEIAHSWTGNLVTNSNGEHFWLNEGHTRFLERKIIDKFRSKKHGYLNAITGWNDLEYTVNEVLGSDHPYTKLVPDLTGVDPDDAFSIVPYEKGSALLSHLEDILGGESVFLDFLRAYIEHFKYKSINTQQWKDYLYEYFKDQKDILDKVEWDKWFYQPGLPPIKPNIDMSVLDVCNNLCKKWVESADEKSKLEQIFQSSDLDPFIPGQIVEFLSCLMKEQPLSSSKIETMNGKYEMDRRNNSEIRFRWIRLCIRAKYEPAVDQALSFVNEQGRMKFVRPVYRDLYAWPSGKDIAIANFNKKRKEMHSTTSMLVAKDLQLSP